MGPLWSCLNAVAFFLESDEQQSVLGDVQERAASPRDLVEIIGLVVLRQLQAFRDWRTWLLGAALFGPIALVLSLAHYLFRAILNPFPRGNPMFLVSLLAVTALAWSCGYTLGSLGKRKTAILLALIPVLIFALGGASPIIVFASLSRATATAAAFLVPAVFSSFGFCRGVRGLALELGHKAILAVALGAAAFGMLPRSLDPSAGIRALLLFTVLWPAGYVLAVGVRKRQVIGSPL